MTPEEDTVIRLALRWHRGWITDKPLATAVQALRISRRPIQGPDPIPCMVRAMHSDTMFCILPKGHVGLPGREKTERWVDYHMGRAAGTPPRGGGMRTFRVWS
jgi:hypothetical protein